MNTALRLIAMLAAIGGAFASAKADPTKPPGTVGNGPDEYKPIATVALDSTMNGVASVKWTVFSWHDNAGKPYRRTNPYFYGEFTSKVMGGFRDVDLLTLGVQHRQLTVYVRFTPTDSTKSVSLTSRELIRDPDGNVTSTRVVTPMSQISTGDFAGFYELREAGPFVKQGNIFVHSRVYQVTCESNLKVEVCYRDHKIGREPAQEEDGGPPPIQPSDLN